MYSKIKIKSSPPASISEKQCLRNILLNFFGLIFLTEVGQVNSIMLCEAQLWPELF